MKKLLAILLCLSMALAFAGCGKDEPVAGTPDGGPVQKEDNRTQKHKDGIGKQEKEAALKSTEFSLNPYYLTMMGRTKSEIDSILGAPTDYNTEFGLTYYGDTVGYGYNTIGYLSHEDIPDDYTAIAAYIGMSVLFDNCPEVITEADLKTIFPDGQMVFNEMDEIYEFSADYKGIHLAFSFMPDLTNTMKAFVKVSDTFTPISE